MPSVGKFSEANNVRGIVGGVGVNEAGSGGCNIEGGVVNLVEKSGRGGVLSRGPIDIIKRPTPYANSYKEAVLKGDLFGSKSDGPVYTKRNKVKDWIDGLVIEPKKLIVKAHSEGDIFYEFQTKGREGRLLSRRLLDNDEVNRSFEDQMSISRKDREGGLSCSKVGNFTTALPKDSSAILHSGVPLVSLGAGKFTELSQVIREEGVNSDKIGYEMMGLICKERGCKFNAQEDVFQPFVDLVYGHPVDEVQLDGGREGWLPLNHRELSESSSDAYSDDSSKKCSSFVSNSNGSVVANSLDGLNELFNESEVGASGSPAVQHLKVCSLLKHNVQAVSGLPRQCLNSI